MTALVSPRFTLIDAVRAGEEWNFNCGPAALAVVAGLTPDEIRRQMGDFEGKGYTNPTLMFDCLNRLGLAWKPHKAIGPTDWHPDNLHVWPRFGLVRVQWEGPWTAPGVPIRVRYRHTHWIAVDSTIEGEEPNVFDVNCMCVGGWVPLSEWTASVVPWLLKQCEPKASGAWHLTHVIEVDAPADARKKQRGTGGRSVITRPRAAEKSKLTK
jgi:hypothetical protein